MEIDEKIVIHPIITSSNEENHELYIQRDDLIHPQISGNKWRKLKYCVEFVKSNDLAGIISYGGAFSNHIVATASACEIHHLDCILYIRGDELNVHSNEYLSYCHKRGANCIFIAREAFRLLKKNSGIIELNSKKYLSIPEGGACGLGVQGAKEIINPSIQFDVVALAAGTTTTTLGILLNSKSIQEIWCFPILKGFNALQEMESLANEFDLFPEWEANKKKLRVFDGYHFGGYAKSNQELDDFITQMNALNDFSIEKVYTAKAMYGMLEELKLRKKRKVLFIHTGGILKL